MNQKQKLYWDTIADDYQNLTTISTNDFHFGPLLPGNKKLAVLPETPKKTRCFEAGCGAAQNSIYLAKQGADCFAVDVSERQIEHARRLAAKNKVSIELTCAALEDPDTWPDSKFDLVHSVFALPFVSDPQHFIKNMAGILAPGGTLLLATQHPVFCAEWLELEDEEMGLFLPSYFEPPEDIRQNSDGSLISSSAYPVATVANWIYEAGLRDLQLQEPAPLPLADIRQNAPYYSPAWIELHPKLSAAPVAIIYSAIKPQ